MCRFGRRNGGFYMEACPNVVAIAALSCQLAQCLTDEELEMLAADLTVLADSLAAIAVRRAAK